MHRDKHKDLLALRMAHGFRPLNEKAHPRTRLVSCPDNGPECSDPECSCDNGIYAQRAPWVNARQVWIAQKPDALVMLMDFEDWMSIVVYRGRVTQSDDLRLHARRIDHANTTSWNGEVAGSGIYNPEGLRGFMYRTDIVHPDGKLGDGYALPADIVEYLLTLDGKPRGYSRGEGSEGTQAFPRQ